MKRSQEAIDRQAKAKDQELSTIFRSILFYTANNPIKIAVLGCGDKRYISVHRVIFEKLLKTPVNITTFDISIEHLKGEAGVIQHDVTQPLPYTPYDITYSHFLLKFIPTKKQWDVLFHSYHALRTPGFAIHIFNDEDVSSKHMNGELNAIPLLRWENKLRENNINFQLLSLSLEGVENKPNKTKALVLSVL